MSSDTPGPGEQQRPSHLSARVPEAVSGGSFSTGIIAMTGNTEFIVDFIQNLGPPSQIVSRVVMPHATLPQFIDALRKNIELYQQRFGDIPPLPHNPSDRQLSAQEIYDELKIPDHVLSGSYCNGVMIGHSVSEFKFDFLTNLFPTSAVSCRVFLSAPQVPRMLESLTKTFQQFQARVQQQREQQQQEPLPPASETGSDNDGGQGGTPPEGESPPNDEET